MLDLLLPLIAGIGAGVVTGFFGGSAALVVVPVMVIFGGYSTYSAVGLALAIDVFCSATAFSVYHKHEKVKLHLPLHLTAFALAGVIFGSLFSSAIPADMLSMIVGAAFLVVSVRFFKTIKMRKGLKVKHFEFISALSGLVVGVILGIVGGGGGIALLLALTLVLKYPIHKAVGTSVLVMVVLALFGAASHFAFAPFPLRDVLIGALGGIVGAVGSSHIANRLSETWLNRVIGVCLVVFGLAIVLRGLALV